MSRVQLALNVSDIDAAVEFYSKLFGAEPAKRRPGYANFAIAEPALKLVLIENAEARGTGVAGARPPKRSKRPPVA
jgi:catechol 2,3-dioxygenase-like lactoylglutathione lyase family enzyme